MDRNQAKELHHLITTVRYVEEMNTIRGVISWKEPVPGCLLCEGVRHGLYTREEGSRLDQATGFDDHFGCTWDEAADVIYHNHIQMCRETTGEIYFQAGKELIEKYGFADLFDETAMPFTQLMGTLMDAAEGVGVGATA